jgi:hypothetical protein
MNSERQTEFHVSRSGDTGGEPLGPWTLDEIAEKLACSEIAVTDFVYDEAREDWIPLLECEALKERLRRQKPKAPPPKARVAPVAPVTPMATAVDESFEHLKEAVAETFAVSARGPSNDGGQWFVQKGTLRYGPFTYTGLVRALQEKSVYEFDFAWTEGMDNWVRIAELGDFQADRIRDLLTSEPSGDTGAFLRRAHPRLKFESEVIVHDDRMAWIGRSLEGSVGGSGLVIENAALYPGQVVRLHFASTSGLPAFNALAEIVNKKFVKEVKGLKTPVHYAVRYLEIEASSAERVKEYFSGTEFAKHLA